MNGGGKDSDGADHDYDSLAARLAKLKEYKESPEFRSAAASSNTGGGGKNVTDHQLAERLAQLSGKPNILKHPPGERVPGAARSRSIGYRGGGGHVDNAEELINFMTDAFEQGLDLGEDILGEIGGGEEEQQCKKGKGKVINKGAGGEVFISEEDKRIIETQMGKGRDQKKMKKRDKDYDSSTSCSSSSLSSIDLDYVSGSELSDSSCSSSSSFDVEEEVAKVKKKKKKKKKNKEEFSQNVENEFERLLREAKEAVKNEEGVEKSAVGRLKKGK
eukprot:Nk52_evm8s276 gene=Nk52_evmTU8s276